MVQMFITVVAAVFLLLAILVVASCVTQANKIRKSVGDGGAKLYYVLHQDAITLWSLIGVVCFIWIVVKFLFSIAR